jgi:TolA-binding protein
LADETRLLRAADQALRSGNAQRAVALLDEHAARYPHGALAPERSAERMIARCQLGQGDASSAQSYLSTHPDSAFTARIRDACGISR